MHRKNAGGWGATALGEGVATKVEDLSEHAAVLSVPLTAETPVVGQKSTVFQGDTTGYLFQVSRRIVGRTFENATVGLGSAWDRERTYGTTFLFVPVFIGVGAWLWYAWQSDPPMALLLVVLFVSGITALRYRHHYHPYALLVHGAFLVILGMALASFDSWRHSTVLLDQPVTTSIIGRVVSKEEDNLGRMRYRIALIDTREPRLRRAPSIINLLARSPHAAIQIGDRIAGRARLSPPSGPALPGLNDFAFDSYFAGTGAIGYFYGKPVQIGAGEVIVDEPIYSILGRTVAGGRSAITVHIRSAIGGDAGAIAAALVTAEQRGISPETVEALRQAGLAHVLAISGLNMVLAAGTFLLGARVAFALLPGVAERFAIKKIAALGGLLAVTLYILISGGAVSAVRSWLMIVVMLIAVLFDRSAISMRNVAISAIAILVVSPSAITGPGFQMSYAATISLVAGYAFWRTHRGDLAPARGAWTPARVMASFAGGLLLSSLIGGCATLIYSIGHFHRIPAYGLIGNLLAMPIISIVVMPMAVLAMLLMPLGLDGIPLALMGRGINWTIDLAHWVAGWGGEVVTGRISPPAFACIALGGAALAIFRTRLAYIGLAPMAIGIALALAVPPGPPPQLLVSEDGKLVALLADGQAASNRTRPPSFIYDQWRRALRIKEHHPPIFLSGDSATETAREESAPSSDGDREALDGVKRSAGTSIQYARREKAFDAATVRRIRSDMHSALVTASDRSRFVCRRKGWCAGVTADGWKVLTLDDPAFIVVACESGDFVVAAQFVNIQRCRSGAHLITARSLRYTGALEISVVEASSVERKGIRFEGAASSLERPWARHRLYDWRTDRFLEPKASTASAIGSGG